MSLYCEVRADVDSEFLLGAIRERFGIYGGMSHTVRDDPEWRGVPTIIGSVVSFDAETLTDGVDNLIPWLSAYVARYGASGEWSIELKHWED